MKTQKEQNVYCTLQSKGRTHKSIIFYDVSLKKNSKTVRKAQNDMNR
jgi:hypothetical protein